MSDEDAYREQIAYLLERSAFYRDKLNLTTPDEAGGLAFFFSGVPSDVFSTCNVCHVLDTFAGFFGSNGNSSFEFEPQNLKIPHLRNLYQKVGMFGMPAVAFFNPGDNGNKGDQVRGFGFLHDGSTDTLFRFHHATSFNQNNPAGFPIPNPGGFPAGPAGDLQRRQVEAFMLAFDSNLAPIVGRAWVGYIPNGRVVGISKLARVVEAYAKRLQIQEKMTSQIANIINDVLKPQGVAVIIKAEHHCMTTRGVHKPGTDLVTSRMLGIFRDNAITRQEFLSMVED